MRVRVKDIFTQQQHIQLDVVEKFLLYEKILSQQQKIERNRMIAKKVIRKGFMAVGLVILSTVFLFQMLPGVRKDIQYTGYELIQPNVFITHANQVGTIVKAQGYFEIVSNGRKIITDQISDGDVITLDEESSLVVKINETIQASIIGPAKFSIHKMGSKDGINQYQVRMLQGDYVAVKNLTGSSPDAVVQIATADGVIIEQDQSKLGGKPKEKIMTDFVFAKKNKKPVIVNRGNDALQVKHVKSSDDTKVALVSKIDTQGILLVDIDKKDPQVQFFSGIIVTGASQGKENLSGENIGTILTTVLGSGDEQSEKKDTSIISEVSSLLQLAEEIVTGAKQEDTAPQGKLPSVGGKKPLPPDVVYKVQQRLYSSFVFNDVVNLVTYYLAGKYQQFNISYVNLQARIHEVYTLVGKEKMVATYDLQGLITQVDELRTFLSKHYIIPASVRKNLRVLSNWLHLLQGYSFGQFAQQDEQAPVSFEDLVKKAGIDTQKQSLKFN